jgi:D-methionine transport system ATP-binding protein
MQAAVETHSGARHEPARSASIRVRALSKRFTPAGPPALDAIDLEIPDGSIHGVIGMSGAGKSTLLRCIALLDKPDSGEIYVAGRNWSSLSASELRRERSRMGIVFQQLHLLSSRTVAANVALPLELHGASREAITHRVAELLDWFGIAEKSNQYPAQLSGGQRQRVALARALATSPRVLLADEPTSALDPETRSSVLGILSRIRDELGITILMITHDLQSAASICDTLTVLDAGRVVETGPAKALLAHPSSEVTRRLLAGSDQTYSPDRKVVISANCAQFRKLGERRLDEL